MFVLSDCVRVKGNHIFLCCCDVVYACGVRCLCIKLKKVFIKLHVWLSSII
jgi:hypothetical protein